MLYHLLNCLSSKSNFIFTIKVHAKKSLKRQFSYQSFPLLHFAYYRFLQRGKWSRESEVALKVPIVRVTVKVFFSSVVLKSLLCERKSCSSAPIVIFSAFSLLSPPLLKLGCCSSSSSASSVFSAIVVSEPSSKLENFPGAERKKDSYLESDSAFPPQDWGERKHMWPEMQFQTYPLKILWC